MTLCRPMIFCITWKAVDIVIKPISRDVRARRWMCADYLSQSYSWKTDGITKILGRRTQGNILLITQPGNSLVLQYQWALKHTCACHFVGTCCLHFNLRGLKLQNLPNSEQIPELILEPEKSEYYEAGWGSILVVSWASVLMAARNKRTNEIFLRDKLLQFAAFAALSTNLKH